jgi:hypothetical protein
MTTKQEQLNVAKEKQSFFSRRVTILEREIEQQDRSIVKLNRMVFYRQRGEIVLEALGPLQNRWKAMIGTTKNRLENLLGNSIFQSAYRLLVACLNSELKNLTLSKIRSSLLRYNINYEDKFTAVPTLAIEYFRWVGWKEPWPLVQTRRPEFANALKFFYNDCPSLDMSQMKWTDKEVVDKLLRASYSDTALVIVYVKDF